jgi:hypothetical protein
MWLKLIGPVLKFIQWLGTILVMKKAGRDAERADNSEKTLETASRVTQPLSDPELQRVREKWRRD